MNYVLRNIFAMLVVCMSPIIFLAQENEIEYKRHLTISDGLAHNGVTCILEDSHGFLWFGTYDGLNRYDGNDLKVFKNTLESKQLVSNRIRALGEDSKENIWIGTDEGITIFEYRTSKFKSLFSNKELGKNKKGPVVRGFTFDNATNSVFVSTETDGVLKFDTDYNFIKQFIYNDASPDKTMFFRNTKISKNSYLYATSKGLIKFNIDNGRFQKILADEIDFCWSVAPIGDKTILVTKRTGIALIEYENKGGDFSITRVKKEILPNYRFNSSVIDSSEKLWLGTLNDGALRFESLESFIKGNYKDFTHFKPYSGLLRVSAFTSTRNADLWMATYDKGVYQFDSDINPFKTFKSTPGLDFGVNNRHIRHIARLDENRFYLTNNKGGVVLFNATTNLFEPVEFQMPNNYDSKIAAIFIDKKKNTWIKVVDKGYFFMRNGDKIPKFVDTSILPAFAKDPAFKFEEDKYGNLWVSCRNDVYRLKIDGSGSVSHLESLNAHPYFKNNGLSLIRYLYSDPLYDFVWLGTSEDGLIRLDITSNKPLIELEVEQYQINDLENSLPSNFVSTITRTPSGDLWIGTEGAGICAVVNSNTAPKFITYSEKDGLSNNVVKSILFDGSENLWVTTNIGLNKFSTIDKTFRRFKKEDGLPFEDFWYTAGKFSDDKLLFTGLEGFCYFSVEDVPVSEELPELQFGNLKISNKTVQPLDLLNKRVLIEERLSDSAVINLNYNENIFSVEIHSLHFKAADNHRIKYKLTPVDEHWIETTSDQKIISYSGLQPDEYTLQVSASNALGEWTQPKTLFIAIAPPYWKTNQAYILYGIICFLLLGTVLYYVLKMQRLRHNIQIEKLEKDAVKTINEAKLRFFANISHELKTPLNLISSPVKVLHEKFKGDKDVEEKLNIVERQSRKINQLIDQVNDFERVDGNTMEMDYSRFYFDGFLKELLTDFYFLAENSNRELTVVANNTNIVVSADRNKLEKIFNNLLSNAFKYSDAGAKITVDYSVNEKDLYVKVKDTGRGIDSEDLPHIFERFFRSRKNQNLPSTGSGIGLAFSKRLVEMHYGNIEAESQLDKGTIMTVRLPIVKKESALDQETRRIEILSAENIVEDKHQWLVEMEFAKIEVPVDYEKEIIFYVEDNVDMRVYVSKMLSAYFKVEVFPNGEECLNAMEEQWPDIIISDIQMPIIDGLELCKRVKSDIKTSHIPIILLTALADIEDRIQGIRDGADAYIQKPFDARQLVTRTVALLENKKRLRERFEIGLPMAKDNNINNRNDDAFLEKLYELMADNLSNENLDMDAFARKLFMNRTHFYQKVKSLTNQTPFELLKMYRLRKAAELLAKDQKLSVSEVYVMAGFKSRTHFSKLFKEKYKVSPGKFVKNQLSN